MNTNLEICYRSALTDRELEEIEALRETGAKRGVGYKLDPGTNSGIVCRRDGAVTGFMTADCFGGPEMESAALVQDLADWDGMAAVLRDCAKEKKMESILFICDPKDTLVREKLESMELSVSFSEYRMLFERTCFTPAQISGFSLRPAMREDAQLIRRLDQGAFGDGEGDVPPGDIARTRMILLQGEPVGKLRTSEGDGMHGIYGVVVNDALRGQGIGYQALTLLLQELTEKGASGIYLEVDSQNPGAFHLYKKLGFRVKTKFGYYPYNWH